MEPRTTSFKASIMLREKEAGALIKAFFENFNKGSSIFIKGDKAELNIVFDEESIPKAIIDAVADCENLEFEYGTQNGTDYALNESKPIAFDGTCEKGQTEISKKEDSDSNPYNPKGYPQLSSIDEIPSIKEIIQTSSSFEEAVGKISNWLGTNQIGVDFEKVVSAAKPEKTKTSWSLIQKEYADSGITFTDHMRITLSKLISGKIQEKGYYVRPLVFIRRVAEYRNHWESEDKTADEATATEVLTVKVRLDCMPEIAEFEEMLGSIDKSQPAKTKVSQVMSAMGAREEEQSKFVPFVTSMLIVRDIDSQLKRESNTEQRAELSYFVTAFARKYDSSKKIKLLDFLTDLQKAIIREEEISG